jgi:Tol biopolymer transport system component
VFCIVNGDRMTNRLSYWLIISLTLMVGGCNNALFVSPQVPVGGLNSQAPDESPAYSSDGRYLAFSSDRNGNRDLYLFDLQQRRLVPLPNLNYVSTERGKTDIMVYDRQTQRSELLSVNVRGTVSHPTISGDGSKVAFQTSQLGQWNIAIVERNLD